MHVYLSGHTSQNTLILFFKLSVWQGGRAHQFSLSLICTVSNAKSIDALGPQLLSAYSMSDTFQEHYDLTHLTFTTTLWGRAVTVIFLSSDEDTEVPRGTFPEMVQ